MNLNQLRVFHAVAQLGSISGAARLLRVSQPAVSKQLAELESSIGAPLVDRLPRGVRLTRIGRALEEHAARLFGAERAAELELASLTGAGGARFSVGASTTIGSYLVPQLFGALRRLHPELQLSLEIGNTTAIHELVERDRVDLGLTEGLETTDALSSQVFSSDELVAVAAPGHAFGSAPLELARFLEQPLILRERGSGTREVLESALVERGLSATPALELGSTEAIKNAVAQGLGIAFVSGLALELELGTARLVRVRLADFSLRRNLHVVELRHRSPSPVAQSFKELLRAPVEARRARDYSI
jgi:DNA-binding transcriptional LysR family regulator